MYNPKEERKEDGLKTHPGAPAMSHPHLSVRTHLLHEQPDPCSWKPNFRFRDFAVPFVVPELNPGSS